MKKPLLLIIGLGPAGTTAAIFLAQLGFQVIAIDRQANRPAKIGESLPPNAQKLLQQLGLWQKFEQAHHIKCFANKSIWGSDQMQYHDFIRQPPGHGWHIDRVLFEKMLLEKAQALGVQILSATSIRSAVWGKTQWSVELVLADQKQASIQPSFIIDASGRNSWLARHLKVDRLYEDQQLALVAFLQSKNKSLEDSTSLLETNEEGWWYSAKIPQEKLATSFLCEPDSEQRSRWTKPVHWWALAKKSTATYRRLIAGDFELMDDPYFVSADSSRLENMAGTGWLAVGDAAMTYDPIASHGILMAMVSSRDAAIAIQGFFNKKQDALGQYQERMISAYEQYRQQRLPFYQMEKRFGTATYWQQRQLVR